MFLTLFYMIATWMKAWQLRSIRTKLLEHVSAESCVVFYKVPEDVEECSRACSSLCEDPKGAHISEVLAVRGSACACALRPTRNLSLSGWRAPPPSPAHLALLPKLSRAPVIYPLHPQHDIVLPSTSKERIIASNEVSVLLECDLSDEDVEELDILPESEAWHILAWHVSGSRLALALRGDMEHLASLAASFLNMKGPLARLQTVNFEGSPISLNDKECVAVSRATIHGSPRHRSKYLMTLEKISKNVPSKLNQDHMSASTTHSDKITTVKEDITQPKNIKDKLTIVKEDIIQPKNIKVIDNAREIKKEGLEIKREDECLKDLNTNNVAIKKEPEFVDDVKNKMTSEYSKDVKNKRAVESMKEVKNKKDIEPMKDVKNRKDCENGNVKTIEPNVSDTNGSITEETIKKTPSVSRKSDLKLELSNKSVPEKPQPKTVTLSNKSKTTISHKKTVTKTLGKRSSSKSSILDEPISIGEKSNRGGASCPSLPIVRPPNILVYSDSAVTRDNIARTLRNVLDPDRYAVYCSGDESSLESVGPMGSSLIVAGGALPPRASAALLHALLGGARVLSLCSDLILTVLPYYRTAEVREKELASFTYDKWSSVKLLHHVFCYQASPARRQFTAAPTPHPTEYRGHNGHVLKVEILAAEQTWHTPSLLQATDERSSGTAVFSQVHLELDAREYLTGDGGSAELARLGVLRKLLTSLGLSTAPTPLMAALNTEPQYTPAYFLGIYERKLEAASRVAVGSLKLVQPRETVPSATSTLTPLLLHACPDNFSPLIYFQELRTENLGRLLIYTEILSSTQEIINEQTRTHGLVIVADRQTKGSGRGGTVWLSPPGCLMFSVQLHSPVGSAISQRAPLLQHISAVAIVMAIRELPGYEDIDIRIKWPNDIYYSRSVKLGGLISNVHVTGDDMVFNIGIGLNLDNSSPTRCLNDIIKHCNNKLAPIEREKLLALILNTLETLFDNIQQTEDFTKLYDLYYKYWLHSDEEVSVNEENVADKDPVKYRVLGIDDFGYLRVTCPSGEITLRPDGNTFDMMRGLIAPKQV